MTTSYLLGKKQVLEHESGGMLLKEKRWYLTVSSHTDTHTDTHTPTPTHTHTHIHTLTLTLTHKISARIQVLLSTLMLYIATSYLVGKKQVLEHESGGTDFVEGEAMKLDRIIAHRPGYSGHGHSGHVGSALSGWQGRGGGDDRVPGGTGQGTVLVLHDALCLPLVVDLWRRKSSLSLFVVVKTRSVSSSSLKVVGVEVVVIIVVVITLSSRSLYIHWR